MHSIPTQIASEDFTVIVAGGGIGGLEAILALRELSSTIRIELLSPSGEFQLTPLSVTEPFGAGSPRRLPIADFCAEHHVSWTRDELAEVWPQQQRILTAAGTELPYDALLISLGARRRNVAGEGAITFRGSGQSEAIEELITEVRAEGTPIRFVVPPGPCWPLPLYELALLVADRVRGSGASIELITPENAPLEIMGHAASARIERIFEEAGITLWLGADQAAEAQPAGEGRVVTIPTLDVPEIPGITQGVNGFVQTDPRMRVQGTDHVWTIGDATWFPVKQGGIATQQADIAAADIVARAGGEVEVPAFAPVLRVALMTPEGPYYLRSGGPDGDGEQRAPLWWPPAKVAGRLLAPYLARRLDPGIIERELVDIDVADHREADHREALALALVGADIDAADGELSRALHWLEIAEGLNLVVPEEYRNKRERWRAELQGRRAR